MLLKRRLDFVVIMNYKHNIGIKLEVEILLIINSLICFTDWISNSFLKLYSYKNYNILLERKFLFIRYLFKKQNCLFFL